jgi:hypothetical protein
MPNELSVIVQEANLEPTQSQEIIVYFSAFLSEVQKYERDAMAINITSANQTEDMARARDIRKILKGLRCDCENSRKERKEMYLRVGKAIDGAANIVKALIVPIEEHLEKQEKFVENLERERVAKMVEDRKEALTPYLPDPSIYPLDQMSEEAFLTLLDNSKRAKDAREEEEKKVEEARLAKEKAEAEERKRIEEENKKLKAEAEAREKEQAKERAEAQKKLEAEQAKAKAEAEARAKVEADLKKKEDDERKANEDIEKAKVEQAKNEKRKEYRSFLKSHGYTEETKGDFYVRDTDEGYVLYKRLGMFPKV